MNYANATASEKLSAISTLLLEIVLLIFLVALSVSVIGGIGVLIAHVIFGASWTWKHYTESMLFLVIIATPLLLIGGLVWMVLRDEYQRILQARMRKW